MSDALPKLHTAPQVAARFGVSVRSIKRLIAQERLRAVRFGNQVRILDEDLQACEQAGLHQRPHQPLELTKERAAARFARRRASKLQRMPAWADKRKIAAIYANARKISISSGISYHVDHVVPLQGPNVCGLHVEHNLEIVTGVVNQAKGNRWQP